MVSNLTRIFPLLLGLVAARSAAAQTQTLDPITVAASRSPLDPAVLPVSRVSFTAADLAAFPAVALDDILRGDAAFSLFRRTSSLSSNPTSQGVSLRGIGPSGASRSLVLLDSIPLNDPFGGWVQWSQVPRLDLAQVDLDHGGGSGLWGNAALAGTIRLRTVTPAGHTGSAAAEYGSFQTRSGEVSAAAQAGTAVLAVDAADFATDGFYALHPADRGAVDRPLNSRHELAQASLTGSAGNVRATATVRYFDESRGNGTPLQANTTRSGIASVAVEGAPVPDLGWSLSAYVQSQRYSSFFSAVAADRSTETPSNNQFAVPASAAGAAATLSWTGAGGVLLAGADFRHVSGETREDFQYTGGAFTRVRFAGGEQDFGGLFLHYDRPLADGLRLSIDARGDRWENADGHDHEYTLAGTPTLTTLNPTRSGSRLDPNVGLSWKASPQLSLRANASEAFRLPTLNEYYRPFRVGTVTTTANPDLVAERLAAAEIGADWKAGAWSASATAFNDDLRDGVGNITLTQSATATTVQRQNLDDIRIRGLEASLRWQASADLTLRVGYLLDGATIRQARAQPRLQGLRLPEVPRQTITASLLAQLPGGLSADARLHWVSLQFDDDLNTLRLPSALIADLELSRSFGRHLRVYVAAENLLDASVATAESATGVFSYDAPALVRGGFRLDW